MIQQIALSRYQQNLFTTLAYFSSPAASNYCMVAVAVIVSALFLPHRPFSCRQLKSHYHQVQAHIFHQSGPLYGQIVNSGIITAQLKCSLS
jgi:hypothetical protein